MNRYFSKRTYMRPTNMEICSSSLAIREMQIKITLRYYLMPVRMVLIKNLETTDTREDAEK